MAHFITVLVAVLRAQARDALPRLPVDDRGYALVVRYRDLIERHYRDRAAARVLRRPPGGDAGAAERGLPRAARHHRARACCTTAS